MIFVAKKSELPKIFARAYGARIKYLKLSQDVQNSFKFFFCFRQQLAKKLTIFPQFSRFYTSKKSS